MKIKDRGLPGTRGKPQFWEITAKRSRRIGWENFIRVGTEDKTLERFKQENPEYTVIKSIKEARILILQHRYLYLDFRDSSRFWVIILFRVAFKRFKTLKMITMRVAPAKRRIKRLFCRESSL